MGDYNGSENRTLIKVTIDDAIEADEAFTTLMVMKLNLEETSL